MQEIKKFFLKCLGYFWHLVFWMFAKIFRLNGYHLNPEEKEMIEHLRKSREDDEKRVEMETQYLVRRLPQVFREKFHELHISGLQFALAVHAVELLISRSLRHYNLGSNFGATLENNGSIGLWDVSGFCPFTDIEKRYDDCNMRIPASTTIHEIMRFVRNIDEEKSAKIVWIIATAPADISFMLNFWTVCVSGNEGEERRIIKPIEK